MIGFKDERRTRGKAKRIKLPIKLPIIRLVIISFGKITGYTRHEKKINNALINGIKRRIDSWYFSSNFVVIHPPNW